MTHYVIKYWKSGFFSSLTNGDLNKKIVELGLLYSCLKKINSLGHFYSFIFQFILGAMLLASMNVFSSSSFLLFLLLQSQPPLSIRQSVLAHLEYRVAAIFCIRLPFKWMRLCNGPWSLSEVIQLHWNSIACKTLHSDFG